MARVSLLGHWPVIPDFAPTEGRSTIPTVVKTVGKIAAALIATLVAGFVAWTSGSYGAIGVHAAFAENLEWTQAAMVYWTLLFTAVLSAVAAVFAWVLLLRHAKSTENPTKSNS